MGTMNTADSDLTDFVLALHNTLHMEVKTHGHEDGSVSWTVTLQGEDFLDGSWNNEKSGTAPNISEAFYDATQAFLVQKPVKRSVLSRLLRWATPRK